MLKVTQGSLLDVDHEYLPHTLRSSIRRRVVPCSYWFWSICSDYVLGITKAYTTRVGSGPYSTELLWWRRWAFSVRRGHWVWRELTRSSRRLLVVWCVALRIADSDYSVSVFVWLSFDVLRWFFCHQKFAPPPPRFYANADGTPVAWLLVDRWGYENCPPGLCRNAWLGWILLLVLQASSFTRNAQLTFAF